MGVRNRVISLRHKQLHETQNTKQRTFWLKTNQSKRGEKYNHLQQRKRRNIYRKNKPKVKRIRSEKREMGWESTDLDDRIENHNTK